MSGFYAQLDVYVDRPQKDNKTVTRATKQATNAPKEEKTIKNKNINKALGFIEASALYANKVVGSYTGNALAENNTKQILSIAGSAIGGLILASNPIGAVVGASIAIAKSGIDYAVNMINVQQQAQYKQSLLGKPTTSGSRWGGKL